MTRYKHHLFACWPNYLPVCDTSQHWLKNQPAKTVPVAYANGNKKINTDAWFSLPVHGSIASNASVELRFAASGFPGGPVYSEWVSVSNLTASDIKALSTLQTIYCTLQPDFIAQMQMNWEIRVNGNNNNIRAVNGANVNPFYVTKTQPTGSGPLYHTVVHTGCVAAKGLANDDTVFNAIWGKFSGDDICIQTVMMQNGAVILNPNGKLYYYGIDSGQANTKSAYIHGGNNTDTKKLAVASIPGQEVITTKGLLEKKDGQCGAWVSFLKDILAVQGINSTSVIVTPTVFNEYNLWIVNNNLAKVSITLNFLANTHANIRFPDTTGKHHGVTPFVSAFSNHYILKYGDNFYDPSYGWEYGSNKDANGNFSGNAQNNMVHKIESFGVNIPIVGALLPLWQDYLPSIPLQVPAALQAYLSIYIAQYDNDDAESFWLEFNGFAKGYM